MPHADYSKFVTASKQEAYEQLLQSAEALIADQTNWVANTANVASLLWHMYKSLGGPLKNVNWAGFYIRDPTAPQSQLILGPFQGQVACQIIALGKGVCGTAAAQRKTQLVPDVEQFPGHIACDGDTKSEIVVPLVKDGQTVAVIDIDCMDLEGFDSVDQRYLEQLAELLVKGCEGW
jgi:L-methionine (R)-S-oxide reductase